MSSHIAITVKKRDGLHSPLDPVFGRAMAFLIINLETRQIETETENSSVGNSEGAGTGAAALMSLKK